jgi:hypothetical protein
MAKKETMSLKPLKLVPPVAPTVPARSEGNPLEYAFPSKSRCPRCLGLNTVSYKTKGAKQYRRCRGAVCRHRYSEEGKPV